MSDPAHPGPVGQYLVALDQRLRGPGGWRRRVIAETADGLCSAVDSIDGVLGDRHEAERRAVADWGCPVSLADDFNQVAWSVRARLVARRILVSVPLLAGGWLFVLNFGPNVDWQAEPPMIEPSVMVLAGSLLAAVASSLVIMIVPGRACAAARRRASPAALVLACAGQITALITVLVILGFRASTAPGSISWPLYTAPLTGTLGLLALTNLDAYAIVRRRPRSG
jgi:hypothetical protein